ncbi:hypothetical protein LPC08_19220 [Roseomonas sp. OT10]|uniref:hypothetical protein n=1 Tax=Roseomonas cutis TaxID=2897332 RepID=UPI001E550AA5|nr:hypothetical protein [Roseomonas sp. OT10]UFN48126.1 hypothetical protein LPC08_19220 [Roseomonas sp. OT10]
MPIHPADHEIRYTSAQACEAAGIPSDTFKNWIMRHPPAILLTDKERKNNGRGRPMMLSFTRIMHITLTAELNRLGMAPRPAAMAAAAFTDTNRGAAHGGWVGEETPPHRLPGQLFPQGTTLLLVTGASDTQMLADCICITPKTPVADLLAQLAACIVVDVNAFDLRVRTVLGHRSQ